LRELAVLLRASATEPGDIVARSGGDEFCVVLAGAEKSRAVERAERLRASIAEADFRGLHAPVSSREEVRISASIGVACYPVDAQSPEALLEKAMRRCITARKPVATAFFFWASPRHSFAATAQPKTALLIDDANEEWQRRPTNCSEIPFRYRALERRRTVIPKRTLCGTDSRPELGAGSVTVDALKYELTPQRADAVGGFQVRSR
jgi:hypothetical protein